MKYEFGRGERCQTEAHTKRLAVFVILNRVKVSNLGLSKHKSSKHFWSLLAKNKTPTNSYNTIKKL